MWPTLVVLTAPWVPAYAETPAPMTAPAAQVTADQLAVEREFWASVKESEDPADIRAYLQQYPGGRFEALARNWLKRLEEAAPRVPATSTVSTQEAVPAPQPSPESVEAALGLTRAQRVQVQRGLGTLGFDAGAADGVLGPRSHGAIAKWQSSRGETGNRDWALRHIAEAQARAGDADAALATARSIDNAYHRAGAFGDIAKARLEGGGKAGPVPTKAQAAAPETSPPRSGPAGQAGGTCGVFVIYSSAPYPHTLYPGMPDEGIWTWAWDRPTVTAAHEAAKAECLRRWARKRFSMDQALLFCDDIDAAFCTDASLVEGRGFEREAHNRCASLIRGDDHITYEPYYSGPTHVYHVGLGPTKEAAQGDGLRKCRSPEGGHFSDTRRRTAKSCPTPRCATRGEVSEGRRERGVQPAIRKPRPDALPAYGLVGDDDGREPRAFGLLQLILEARP